MVKEKWKLKIFHGTGASRNPGFFEVLEGETLGAGNLDKIIKPACRSERFTREEIGLSQMPGE